MDGDDIKVHYVGWSLSNDEWLNVNSDRVVTRSGNETVWTRTSGVVHGVGATTTSQSLVDGSPESNSVRGAGAESADSRQESDEESNYTEAEETVAEEDRAAHSPLRGC